MDKLLYVPAALPPSNSCNFPLDRRLFGSKHQPQIEVRFPGRAVTNLVIILTDIGLLDSFK